MLKQTILKIMGLIVLWGKKITNKMYSGTNRVPLTLQISIQSPTVRNFLDINPFKARLV